LVDREGLDEVVTRYVNAILECEPSILRSMKQYLNQTADGHADVAAQAAAYQQSLRSEELRRRLELFGPGSQAGHRQPNIIRTDRQ
jgi:1,4-dihydroxy-2-naphthoyl-CoA synthase